MDYIIMPFDEELDKYIYHTSIINNTKPPMKCMNMQDRGLNYFRNRRRFSPGPHSVITLQFTTVKLANKATTCLFTRHHGKETGGGRGELKAARKFFEQTLFSACPYFFGGKIFLKESDSRIFGPLTKKSSAE